MRIRRQGETLSVRRKLGKARKKRVEKDLERNRGKMRIRRQGETLSVGRKQGKQGRKERSREGIRKKKRKEENKETRRNEGQFLLGANGKAMRKDGKKVEKRGK